MLWLDSRGDLSVNRNLDDNGCLNIGATPELRGSYRVANNASQFDLLG